MRALAILFAIMPTSCSATLFYGYGDMTLGITQQEREGAGYQVVKLWSLPVTVTYKVETDFNTSRLIGIEFNIHDTIYEDISQHFQFSFGIEGGIAGPGPVDIDALTGNDIWQSDTYWDRIETRVTLERRVFDSISHAETHVVREMDGQAWDRFNFSDFPSSILYHRAVFSRNVGEVSYSEDEKLSFGLQIPSGWITLAPDICTQAACGDYNQDGIVDAADLVVWRDTLNQTGSDLAADGNGNNKVEAADYYIWRRNFGTRSDFAAGQSAPEPATPALVAIALVPFLLVRHATRFKMLQELKL